jgi:hypothetical protein
MSELAPEITPTPETTPTPAANTPEARTETGELKPANTTPTPPTPETKSPEGEKKPDATTGAPETYAEFKAPEGYTIDKALIDKAAPIFKELNLNQDAAQKLVEFYATTQLDGAKAGEANYSAMRETWRGEVLKDTTLSSGSDLKPEVKQAIGRTVDSLGPELAKEFRATMDLTGAGDNPAFVKAMYKLSEFVTEGRPVAGGGPSPAGQKAPGSKPPSIASAMFPNLA